MYAPAAMQQPFSTLIVTATCLRLALIFYGGWHDEYFAVKYTDIDYEVITDAARHIHLGGSPFARSTFRYTPLLAIFMLPNVLLFKAFGKLLFATADIAVAWLLLQRTGAKLQGGHRASASRVQFWALALWLFNPYTATISTRGNGDAVVTLLQLALLQLMQGSRTAENEQAAYQKDRAAFSNVQQAMTGHASGTPGKADIRLTAGMHGHSAAPLESASLVSQRAADSTRRARSATRVVDMALAGCIFGLLVHWRVFPLIYGPSLVLHIWHTAPKADRFWHWITRCVAFGAASLTSLLGLTGLFFHLYGSTFLHEAYLHHASRRDPRHNFSSHFYFTYLQHFGPAVDSEAAGLHSWTAADVASNPANVNINPDGTALLCVLCPILTLAVMYSKQLDFCWLLSTIVFVAFNKVCTAQYFVWYFGLLALCLPDIDWTQWKVVAGAFGFWLVAQLHWLWWAYLLEFQGLPIYGLVWLSSCIFMAAHAAVVIALVRTVRMPSVQHTVDERKKLH